jgi:hypothetical protein
LHLDEPVQTFQTRRLLLGICPEHIMLSFQIIIFMKFVVLEEWLKC